MERARAGDSIHFKVPPAPPSFGWVLLDRPAHLRTWLGGPSSGGAQPPNTRQGLPAHHPSRQSEHGLHGPRPTRATPREPADAPLGADSAAPSPSPPRRAARPPGRAIPPGGPRAANRGGRAGAGCAAHPGQAARCASSSRAAASRSPALRRSACRGPRASQRITGGARRRASTRAMGATQLRYQGGLRQYALAWSQQCGEAGAAGGRAGCREAFSVAGGWWVGAAPRGGARRKSRERRKRGGGTRGRGSSPGQPASYRTTAPQSDPVRSTHAGGARVGEGLPRAWPRACVCGGVALGGRG
jgi:hypothetical protein